MAININLNHAPFEASAKRIYAALDKMARYTDVAINKMERMGKSFHATTPTMRINKTTEAIKKQTRAVEALHKGRKRLNQEAEKSTALTKLQKMGKEAERREGSLSARMQKLNDELAKTPRGTRRYQQLAKEARSLGREFDKLHTPIGRAGTALKKIWTSFAHFTIFVAAALFVVTGFVSILKLLKDVTVAFLRAGADIPLRLGQIATAFQMGSEQAKRFGEISEETREKTGASQEKVNKAFTELVKAGLSGDKAVAKLDKTLTIARNSGVSMADAAFIAATNVNGLADAYLKLDDALGPDAQKAWKKFVETFKTFSKDFYKTEEPRFVMWLEELSGWLDKNSEKFIRWADWMLRAVEVTVREINRMSSTTHQPKGVYIPDKYVEQLGKSQRGQYGYMPFEETPEQKKSLGIVLEKPPLERQRQMYAKLHKGLGHVSDEWRKAELAALKQFYNDVFQLEGPLLERRIRLYNDATRGMKDQSAELQSRRKLFRATGDPDDRLMELELSKTGAESEGLLVGMTPKERNRYRRKLAYREARKQERPTRWRHEQTFEQTGIMTDRLRAIRDEEARYTKYSSIGKGVPKDTAARQETVAKIKNETDANAMILEKRTETFEATSIMSDDLYRQQREELRRYRDTTIAATGEAGTAWDLYYRQVRELQVDHWESQITSIDGIRAAHERLLLEAEPLAKRMSDIWTRFAKNMNTVLKTEFFDLMSGEFKRLEDVAVSVLKVIQRALIDTMYTQLMFGSSGSGGASGWLSMAVSAAISAYGGSGSAGGTGGGQTLGNAPPNTMRAHHGGVISEHIKGVGQMTGRAYEFGEGGVPEIISPFGEGGLGGGGKTEITIIAMDSQSFAEVVQRNPQVILSATNKALEGNPAGRNALRRMT